MSDSNITTLDPQLVSSKAELSYAYACFERLFLYDKDGNLIKNTQVEDYSVSADGLTYTFILSDGFYWSDGETKITANDFAFGLKRAILQETKAPFAKLLSSISGFDEVHYNNASVDSKLGISSTENKLTINLKAKNDAFLHSLAHPVSAPCNEEFFISTKGKYGLDTKNIITNGAYYISKLNKDDSSLTLRKSRESKNLPTATLDYAKIIFNASADSVTDSAKEDTYNIYNSTEDVFKRYTEGKSNTYDSFDTTYGLYMSNDLISGKINIAEMLTLDIDKSTLLINLPDYCKDAKNLIPSDLICDGKSFEKTDVNLNYSSYNKEKALQIRGNNKETFEKLSKLNLYYPDTSVCKTYASLISQTWQKDLNAYINIQPYKESELSKILNPKEQTSVLAIIPIKSTDGTAGGVSAYFEKLNSPIFQNAGETASQISNAQQSLVNSCTLYPLFECANRYIYDDKIDFVSFISHSGIVDFRYIAKIKN